jgi:hypothetical protein
MPLRIPSATIVGLALVGALATGRTYSADDHGYRTGTLVPSTSIECVGAPACVSTTFPAVTVQPGRRHSTRVACPASHPYLWGWDAAQHEHIQVELLAVDGGTATIEGANKADVPGRFIVSLGCSTEPFTGTQMQKSRIFAATQALPERQSQVSGQPGSTQAQNPCTSGTTVPHCQAQQQQGFFMWGWQTGHQYFDCKAPYPYVWNYTYTEADGKGVTSIGYQFQESPQTYDIWFTNWSVYETGTIVVTLACSKTNSWGGGACGPISDDPMCPVLPGTTKYNCSKTFPGVCFSTYQERCAPSDPILDCTLDFVFRPWCQAAC